MTKKKGMVYSFLLMVVNIVVSGRMVSNMVRGNLLIGMVKPNKESGVKVVISMLPLYNKRIDN